MNGLTNDEVIKQRRLYGSNNISLKNENKFIKILLATFADPIIKIILIALSVRFVLMFQDTNWFETLGMLISVLLSSLISSISEYSSNESFKNLQDNYNQIKSLVIRNNREEYIGIDDLVVGDIVLLSSGDIIPADGVVIEGEVGIDESSINGEASEVLKSINDKVLRGCVVLSESAKIKIESVGLNTVYGNIAREINSKSPDTPMKIRLQRLASTISRIGYIGAVLVSISYLFNNIVVSNNFDWNVIFNLLKNPNYVIDNLIHTITLALTTIILVVPEGLPLMVSLVLSSNMKRMYKSNVLVRKSVGIETCGSLNVLLTDKTGTLTEGNMEVVGIVDSDGELYQLLDELNDNLLPLFKNSLVYNTEAKIVNNKIVGSNATEKSILKYVGSSSMELDVLERLSFNSINKYSYVLLSDNNKYYKGAYEVLIKNIIYRYDKYGNKKLIKDKKVLESILYKYTNAGIRVISLVVNNVFLGFVLLKDRIRAEARESIHDLMESGINIVMVTGDDVNTSSSIARELDLLSEDSIILTHDDLATLSDQEILSNINKIKVVARSLPSDKSRIASILVENNIVVGMTGDGVNDAPALKKANVGISLGSGSEVAKSASEIVILDDNIKSIKSAVLYGRTIFKSIRKFIIFQLTMNLTALFLSIIGPWIGFITPITIVQMLWLNMIMDTLAGLAFSYEYPHKKYLKEKPLKKDEHILNKYMLSSIILNSLYCAGILVIFLKLPLIKIFIRSDMKIYLTAFFSLFVFLCFFNAFNARTELINIFYGIRKNLVFIVIMLFVFITQLFIIYEGGNLFRTYGLTINELTFILLLSFSIIPFDILRKIFFKIKK